MNLNEILAVASKMFPSADLKSAAEKAQTALQGTPDTLEGVANVAAKMGINQAAVDGIYQKVGHTMQAKMICKMMGTTPEAIKADAEKMLGSGTSAANTRQAYTPPTGGTKKFPRLK